MWVFQKVLAHIINSCIRVSSIKSSKSRGPMELTCSDVIMVTLQPNIMHKML